MILIDTNIWIDHFRAADTRLTSLVTNGAAWQHTFVTGELAVGSLQQRDRTLLLLRSLPKVTIATEDAVYAIIDELDLVGTGLGFVDVHILAALREMPMLRLWTRDQRLATQAARLGRIYHPG